MWHPMFIASSRCYHHTADSLHSGFSREQFVILHPTLYRFPHLGSRTCAPIERWLTHSKVLLRRMGYIWVYCWFVYSLAPWVDSAVSPGAYEHACMNLSLIILRGMVFEKMNNKCNLVIYCAQIPFYHNDDSRTRMERGYSDADL
jgi:hypothetical protein